MPTYQFLIALRSLSYRFFSLQSVKWLHVKAERRLSYFYSNVIVIVFYYYFFSGEITKPTDKVLVARGGMGGVRASRFQPTKGQQKNLYLDLKLIADVGFVG